MDFFDRQDRARRQTTHLLIMFAAAVAVIIVAVYFVAVFATGYKSHMAAHVVGYPGPSLWNPGLFAMVSLGTILVVSLGSLYKIAELAGGGRTVAEMMGGRLVDQHTTDPAERRLLNVVEEISIASGVPVPPVYVLDNEPSINAFAAGYQPTDAVVAVSRGCLDYLTREELQGVLGHEFSHLLNGDMRLNLRLVGIVYGILVLSIIGYYVMRSGGTSSYSSRSDRRDSGGNMFLIGLAIYILGYLGVLLGNIIKSAISRQREFLADASSVQFTRNPSGLAGALKKIGGLAQGSQIRDPHAAEVSHMFFADGLGNSLMNLFATHPPLEERIRLLDPSFAGQFPEVAPLDQAREPVARVAPASAAAQAVAGLAGSAAPAPRAAPRVGQPQTEHLEQAGRLMAAMPPALTTAARDPYSARAVIFALLLSRENEATRNRQLQMLQSQTEPPVYRLALQLAQAMASIPPENRLPLVDLTVPALKQLSPNQYAAFRPLVEALTTADGQVDLFEYCLRVVLFGYLDVQFGLKPPPTARYRAITAVARPAAVVLSSLAYVGQSQPADIQRAYQAGAAAMALSLPLLPPPQCTFDAFDAALGELNQAMPQVKRRVLDGVLACIAADGKTTLEEAELLRAIAAALGCPMPPGVS